MFESLTHWFDSLQEQSRLFNNCDDETLHTALASVLYHVINADNKVASREKHAFAEILQQEFGLDNGQINHLYQAAESSCSKLETDLHTVNRYLKQKPAVRLKFMQKLMQLIDINGTEDPELELFYQTLHEVFPDIKA